MDQTEEIEELHGSLRIIHDLERAIRLWELVRDCAQQVVSEKTARHEKRGDSIETNQRVARARAFIDACDASILVTKARIDELERGD
jgi:hypothetical protein